MTFHTTLTSTSFMIRDNNLVIFALLFVLFGCSDDTAYLFFCRLSWNLSAFSAGETNPTQRIQFSFHTLVIVDPPLCHVTLLEESCKIYF